jgi:hypothetical protein
LRLARRTTRRRFPRSRSKACKLAVPALAPDRGRVNPARAHRRSDLVVCRWSAARLGGRPRPPPAPPTDVSYLVGSCVFRATASAPSARSPPSAPLSRRSRKPHIARNKGARAGSGSEAGRGAERARRSVTSGRLPVSTGLGLVLARRQGVAEAPLALGVPTRRIRGAL